MDKVKKKNTMSVNVTRALFYHLVFLTLEAGTDSLSRHVIKKLPLYAA